MSVEVECAACFNRGGGAGWVARATHGTVHWLCPACVASDSQPVPVVSSDDLARLTQSQAQRAISVCPKCGANQKDAKGDSSPTPSRARRSAAAAAAPVAPPPPPEPDLDEIEPVEGAVVADDDEEDLVFKGADGEEDEDEDEEE